MQNNIFFCSPTSLRATFLRNPRSIYRYTKMTTKYNTIQYNLGHLYKLELVSQSSWQNPVKYCFPSIYIIVLSVVCNSKLAYRCSIWQRRQYCKLGYQVYHAHHLLIIITILTKVLFLYSELSVNHLYFTRFEFFSKPWNTFKIITVRVDGNKAQPKSATNCTEGRQFSAPCF